MQKPKLAIVVPCFNEKEVINICYGVLSEILSELTLQNLISPDSFICFIDDGSYDNSWEIIKELAKNKDAQGIKLSRNYGHQMAIFAGLTQSRADIYISIDADLQDDVSAIKDMVEKYHQGYDVIYAVRNDRSSDTFFKRIVASCYYKLNVLFRMKTIYNHADYRLISDKIAQILRTISERNLYLRGLIPSLGFKSAIVYYARKKRVAGQEKYSLLQLITLALEGITSYSTVPLRFITILGLLCFIFTIVMSIFYFTQKTGLERAPEFISMYFLGGIQLLSIGIIGEYIGKIYQETKQRPCFLIEEETEENRIYDNNSDNIKARI